MRTLFASLPLFIFFVAHGQIKKLNAETAIQQVTIFSSGARVERQATVNIQSGRSEISFSGLSNQLDQQTVQLKADASILLLSVQTMKDFVTERKVAEQEQQYIDHVNALKDKLDLDQKQMDVYKNEEAMLSKNQAIGGETGVKTAELKEALEFQRQRLTDIYTKELEIQKRLVSGQQDLNKTSTQLQEFSKKKDSISYIVTSLIESKETRTVNFQLFYNIKDAGWFPAYDVRVAEINQPLSIRMNANVFQRSGETWQNIPLILSTGNPNDNATPSQLQTWMLGFYDPSVSFHSSGAQGEISGRITNIKGEPLQMSSIAVKGSSFGVSADANGYFKLQNINRNSILVITALGYEKKEVSVAPGYLSIALTPATTLLNDVVVTGFSLQSQAAGLERDEPDKKMKENLVQTVSVSTQYQPTTTIYRIDEKYTLESDGKLTTIGIKQFDLPAIYNYYIAPKIDPGAFLTAKIISWQDYNLQSGEASLYYEGSYLGKTYIDLGSTEDTLSLSLGKDNGIKVVRKLLKEYSTKKFIGSNRTDSRQYEISIRNSKNLPASIILVDQVPVSTNKEINVDDVKASEALIDKDSGLVTWTTVLSPSQEKKFGLSYNVKYPKDRKVVVD